MMMDMQCICSARWSKEKAVMLWDIPSAQTPRRLPSCLRKLFASSEMLLSHQSLQIPYFMGSPRCGTSHHTVSMSLITREYICTYVRESTEVRNTCISDHLYAWIMWRKKDIVHPCHGTSSAMSQELQHVATWHEIASHLTSCAQCSAKPVESTYSSHGHPLHRSSQWWWRSLRGVSSHISLYYTLLYCIILYYTLFTLLSMKPLYCNSLSTSINYYCRECLKTGWPPL